MLTILLALAASTAGPQGARPPLIVIIDNSRVCGIGGRVADYQIRKAEAAAKKAIQAAKAEGREVRVIRNDNAIQVGSFNGAADGIGGAPVFMPIC
ncbi:hypothetical protein [Sphingobium chungbukense]|uniref:Uncharacterized protein n=1 Tax=Sphingobium chungbukense TaxID=56193 RepID=A0A0M3ATI0_9SPHN|nr:hypothetical protein [Sphingobium chungbukense]KKW92241.1 hypothetical protein YP76_09905 [Sphingobium chungbukense]